MREDTARALDELQRTDSRAHKDLYQRDVETIDSSLGGGERLHWLQSATYNSDPGNGVYAGAIHVGVVGVTDQRVIFASDSAASQWRYADIQAVQHGQGGRLGGGQAGFALMLRHEDPEVFYLERKTRDANQRLFSILEEQIRKGALAPAAESPVSTAAATEASIPDQLAKLAELHQQGVLDEAEFAAAKQRLLA